MLEAKASPPHCSVSTDPVAFVLVQSALPAAQRQWTDPTYWFMTPEARFETPLSKKAL
jgi:hypothetical protein